MSEELGLRSVAVAMRPIAQYFNPDKGFFRLLFRADSGAED
jgi:hypothetical protein